MELSLLLPKIYRFRVLLRSTVKFWLDVQDEKFLVRQSCTPKNQLQVAKNDESYTVFFKQLIQTYGLVVKVSCRESGDMGLILDEC